MPFARGSHVDDWHNWVRHLRLSSTCLQDSQCPRWLRCYARGANTAYNSCLRSRVALILFHMINVAVYSERHLLYLNLRIVVTPMWREVHAYIMSRMNRFPNNEMPWTESHALRMLWAYRRNVGIKLLNCDHGSGFFCVRQICSDEWFHMILLVMSMTSGST